MVEYITRFFWEIFQSGLLLDELMHGVVAFPFACFLWFKSHSVRQVIVFYLVVYFIDSDHLVDYWLFWGFGFDAMRFFGLDFFKMGATFILPFHAWEWVIIMSVFVYRKGRLKWKSVLASIMLAVFAHLLWDIHNFWSVEFYSIFYRAINGFRFG